MRRVTSSSVLDVCHDITSRVMPRISCFHVVLSSKLRADLPERVDDKAGTAKWDATKSILSVTLPIVRDID